MATIGTKLTLADHAKRMDPDGKIARIAEMLEETNDILEDMVWLEGNLPTGHRSTIRSGLPTPTWRKLNYGVQPDKSRTVQVDDTVGMLEAYAEVDKDLADLNGNTNEFRMSEDRAHIESISQALADTVIYGDTDVNPERFLGIAPRYDSLSAENAALNIISGGGSGSDNTSMWLFVWGPNTVHGIFPKGSQAGLKSENLGQVTLEDAANGRYEGYRTHYQQKAGLVLRDWRYVVRVCNIDVSDLGTIANTANLVTWLTRATERIPTFAAGRAVIYVNRFIREHLRLGILEKISSNLTWETVAGQRVMMFDGIAVKRVDALLNTEATIS